PDRFTLALHDALPIYTIEYILIVQLIGTRAQAASGEQPPRVLPLTFPRQSDHLPGSIEFRAHRLGFIQPGLGTVHVPRVREFLEIGRAHVCTPVTFRA